MIRQLSGVVTDLGPTFIVLEVGGVGYLIHTDSPMSYPLEVPVRFFTYLAVRENSLDLYGFADRDTLEVFELLIELPKIGPKSALQILTAADTSLLKEAVRNNDPSYLSKLSGIGKKSAEKIVSGLKDKFTEDDYPTGSALSDLPANIHQLDTIDALISLGYPSQEARRVVIQVSMDNPDIKTSSDVIKLALRLLSGK